MMNREFGRRTFMKRAGGFIVAGSALETLLAACGGNVSTTTGSGTSTPGTVHIANKGLKTPGVMQWGATSAGGAPYVFQDPANPNNKVGFEVEIAMAMANLMGVTQKQIEIDYSALEQALRANQFDFIMNGWEKTPDREKTEIFSQAYYRYGQQIVVRANDSRFSQFTATSDMSLKDLEGYKVGTGAAYKAADILKSDPKIDTKTFDPDLPFDALTQKNLDAVLIDGPIVSYYVLGAGPGGKPNPALKPIGKPFETSDYFIGFNKSNSNATILSGEIDEALTQLKKDGTLQKIYKKWSMWNDQQAEIGIM